MKRLIFVFLLLTVCDDAFAMRKLIDKVQGKLKGTKRKQHADHASDLRTAWMCECEACEEKLRIENKEHMAARIEELKNMEPDRLGLTPEQWLEYKKGREVRAEQRAWQLRLEREQRALERAERPQRKAWKMDLGCPDLNNYSESPELAPLQIPRAGNYEMAHVLANFDEYIAIRNQEDLWGGAMPRLFTSNENN